MTFDVNGVKKPPYFIVQPDGTLQLTVESDDLCICQECPNIHIRVFTNATPATLRRFAEGICRLAEQLESE